MPVFIVAVVLAAAAAVLPAQTPVVAPVTVKDAQGRLVPGLEAADFRLLEDGVEQKIASFSADPAPLSAAVLLDAGISRATAERLRETFPSLVEAFSEFDEAGIFTFLSGLRAAVDFTSDRERLREGLRGLEIGADYTQAGDPLSQPVPRINNWPVSGPPAGPARGAARARGSRNIDGAVIEALRLLDGRPAWRRKIILLISDGLKSQGQTASSNDLYAALRRSDVTVYSIGLDGAKLPRGSAALGRYAPPTGGELFTAVKAATIEPLYGRITEQARYAYRLAYVPIRPATVAPKPRAVEVRVKRSGLTVIARDGYLPGAQAPAK